MFRSEVLYRHVHIIRVRTVNVSIPFSGIEITSSPWNQQAHVAPIFDIIIISLNIGHVWKSGPARIRFLIIRREVGACRDLVADTIHTNSCTRSCKGVCRFFVYNRRTARESGLDTDYVLGCTVSGDGIGADDDERWNIINSNSSTEIFDARSYAIDNDGHRPELAVELKAEEDLPTSFVNEDDRELMPWDSFWNW